MEGKVDINKIFNSLLWLSKQEGNHNAKIAVNALGELPATIQPIYLDFADFCEAIEIEEDDLINAMKECER